MIRTFIQKYLQYVIETHIRIYGEEYNYDDSFAAFISNTVETFAQGRWELALDLETGA